MFRTTRCQLKLCQLLLGRSYHGHFLLVCSNVYVVPFLTYYHFTVYMTISAYDLQKSFSFDKDS